MSMVKKYQFFEWVDEGSNMAKLFNKVFENLDTHRIVCAPATHIHFNEVRDTVPILFYDLALTECYFHGVAEQLSSWKSMTDKYISEFGCNWRDYAAADRNELIEKYGYDESDYDENGNLREVTDDMLKSCSIVRHFTGYNHNIFTTKPNDLYMIYSYLINKNRMSIFKFFEQQGEELNVYRQDENGEMIPLSYSEKVIREALDNGRMEDIADLLYSCVDYVYKIATDVQKLKEDEDNKNFFTGLQTRIDKAFALDIPIIENPFKMN